MIDEETREVYSDKFIIHVIELKKVKDTPKEEQGELYRWAKLIAAKDWEMVNMAVKGNPYMEEAMHEMDKINLSEKERYLYLRESMAYTDQVSRLRTAMEAGEKKGRKEGERNKLRELVEKKLRKEKTVEVIADELEEDVDVIIKIIKEMEDKRE